MYTGNTHKHKGRVNFDTGINRGTQPGTQVAPTETEANTEPTQTAAQSWPAQAGQQTKPTHMRRPTRTDGK